MSEASSWMLYGATGFTGASIARRALEQGHRPLLAGRKTREVAALGEQLGLPRRTLTLDDPVALRAGLADVRAVVNAAGPFLNTAAPLAEACIDAGVHYLDISNELQVFRALYDLDRRARHAAVLVVPGVGFGVVSTNCLAREVSDAVGGAEQLEVAALVSTGQGGPGVAATREANIPFGGWIRRDGSLQPLDLGEGIATIAFPDGPATIMPVPTGDLEAAFRATDAPDVTAYTVLRDPVEGPPYRSFGWARAANAGITAEAWLQTGDAYGFTSAAAIRAVEATLAHSGGGSLSPATAFGSGFAFTVADTFRIDTVTTR
jgi:short subunit dehydrogenase-like uncharacterized protein